MKYSIYLLLIVALISSSLYGQDVRKVILTHENMNRLDGLDNSLVSQREEGEADVLRAMTQNRTFKEKTIALVFHIIYDDDAERVGESQVYQQIEALNRDFSGTPQSSIYPGVDEPRFRNRSSDPELKFCLSKVNNPNLTAINYILTEQAEWAMDDAMKSSDTGGADPWNTDKYLNVWVVDLDNASGYAQMPSGPEETDGVVIDYRFFGDENTISNFSEGKTLTHLIGNYLGLYSLWGNGECEDDLVQDTPIHSSQNHDCGSNLHASFCGEGGFEMPMNFMDSTPDECQSMFTFGQKIRLHAFLSVPSLRGKLTNTVVDCSTDNLVLDEGETPVEGATKTLAGEGISIFPNPTSKDVVVRFFEDYGPGVTVSLIDQNGRTVKEISGINAQKGVVPLRLGLVSPGTYYLSFSKNGISLVVKRLIVTM